MIRREWKELSCLFLACALFLMPVLAKAAPGDSVRCTVTSPSATVYKEMNRDEPLLFAYRQGAVFTAYETEEEVWLWVETTDRNGKAVHGYMSILDLAVAYRGEEAEDEEAVGSGLAESGYMPPDDVDFQSGGLPLDGILQNYRIKTEKAYVFSQPDVESDILARYEQGSQFKGVLQEDGKWIQVVVNVDGQEAYGYVPYGRITLKSDGKTEKDSNKVVIRITSGVITVYSKPDKESQQLGVVTAPVRFEGQKTKSGKWVRVELDGAKTPKYGYIEARYITQGK